jgi:hypothetical protein
MPIVNVDGERALAVVRASGAKSDISLGSQHFGVGVAIGADADVLELATSNKSQQQTHSTAPLMDHTQQNGAFDRHLRDRGSAGRPKVPAASLPGALIRVSGYCAAVTGEQCARGCAKDYSAHDMSRWCVSSSDWW